jgi:heptosyltransferase-2
MHLASAVGRPVVAVFGPTDDVATAPMGRHVIVRHPVWCRPCLLRECPIDHRCMRGVTPDAVFAALTTTLSSYAPLAS